VFVILQTLRADGWSLGVSPDVHTKDTVRNFGLGGFVQKSCYLRCLVAWDLLVGRGLENLPSKKKEVFYKCVLSSEHPANVVTTLSVNEYNVLLADSLFAPLSDESLLRTLPVDDGDAEEEANDEDNFPLLALPSSGSVLSKRPRPEQGKPAQVSRKDSSSSTSSSTSDGEMVNVPNVPQLLGPGSDVAGGEPGAAVDELPLLARGVSRRERLAPDLTMEDYTRADGTRYRRMFIQCPLQHGEHWSVGCQACCKQRSIGPRTTAMFGEREPEAFLRAWCAAASRFRDGVSHNKFTPSKADVRAQIGQ
jgi:hypothetical protein